MNSLKATIVLLVFLVPAALLPDYHSAAAPEPAVNDPQHSDTTTITLEIPAGADTFTASGKPDTNFASDGGLRVGFNIAQGNGAQRIFLFFSLSSIPPTATIQSARLRLHLNSFSPSGDSSMGLLARTLNTPWDASTLTWANYDPSWSAEMGIGAVPAASGWIESSITSIVQDWVSGDRANYGLMIQGDETPQQRERVFTSINANNGLHPRLVVTYNGSNQAYLPSIAYYGDRRPCHPGSFEIEPNNSRALALANGSFCIGRTYRGLPADQWDVFAYDLDGSGHMTCPTFGKRNFVTA